MQLIFRGLLLRQEHFVNKTLGPFMRKCGQGVYRLGAKIQGDYFKEDTCP
jgi:hypothetical protein